MLCVIVLPWLAVLIYVIANGDGMAQRAMQVAQQRDQATRPTSSKPPPGLQPQTSYKNSASSTRCCVAASGIAAVGGSSLWGIWLTVDLGLCGE
jgi:hypothetical protein